MNAKDVHPIENWENCDSVTPITSWSGRKKQNLCFFALKNFKVVFPPRSLPEY